LNLYHRTIGEGKPLIILHGLFGSSENWMTLGNVFSKSYKVIMVDLRNHGQSPHSDQWDYASMAEDVYILCEQLGLKKINLLGHSMGGKVGMTLPDKYPELIDKLVVADIAPKHYPIRHRQIIDGLLAIDIKNISNRKEADTQLSSYISELGIRMFLLKNLDKNHEGGFNWKLNLNAISNHLDNVGLATLPKNKIDIPSLFVRGINSDYVSDDDIMEIRKHYSRSTVETIGNAGHWIHAEQPEAFAKTVLDFLQD
jgi:pimeloyl-ACP methyl ester carboxylesterase